MLHLNVYASKIQKWWAKKNPGCYKCGSKSRLLWRHICAYCYHDKYSDDCLACKDGSKHNY